jgi:hypothetical protein
MNAIGLIGEPLLGQLAVQRLDVAESNLGHLHVRPEMRRDMLVQHAAVGSRGVVAFLDHVLGSETRDQLGHGRCGPGGLARSHRIFAAIDRLPQPAGLGAGIGGGPVAESADVV